MNERIIMNVIHPESIFNILNSVNKEDAEKALTIAFSFLLYLKVGDCLKTGTATFNKIGPDLIQIDCNLDPSYIADELVGKRIIKFPF